MLIGDCFNVSCFFFRMNIDVKNLIFFVCFMNVATIIPSDSSDKRGPIDVYVKVLILYRASQTDKTMRNEYDDMYLEKEKYEFLCYCGNAEVVNKPIAFVAYKPFEQSNYKNKSSKRKSDSDLVNPENKKPHLKN